MSADPVAELLSDPRFRGKPITWGVTSESYDAVRRAWLTHVHAEEVLFEPFTEDGFKTQMVAARRPRSSTASSWVRSKG
jgi:hypothetical protein